VQQFSDQKRDQSSASGKVRSSFPIRSAINRALPEKCAAVFRSEARSIERFRKSAQRFSDQKRDQSSASGKVRGGFPIRSATNN
jgi:hypothetical protein